jgi:hypothetical protein
MGKRYVAEYRKRKRAELAQQIRADKDAPLLDLARRNGQDRADVLFEPNPVAVVRHVQSHASFAWINGDMPRSFANDMMRANVVQA